jgi:hypothetical protein
MQKQKLLLGIVAALLLTTGVTYIVIKRDTNVSNYCTLEARAGLVINLTDENGSPVVGANIASVDLEKSTFRETNPGFYAGLYEARGSYEFTIRKEGYQMYTGNVQLVQDSCHVITQTQNIILKKV